MKTNNKITMALALMIGLSLSLYVKAQEQVVLKAKVETIKKVGDQTKYKLYELFNYSFMGELFYKMFPKAIGKKNAATDAINNMTKDQTTLEYSTITYTQESMKMVVKNDTATVTMLLRFNPEGTRLFMTIKIADYNSMTMSVPKNKTISSTSQNQLGPAGIASTNIIGYHADKYVFKNESILDLLPGDSVSVKRSDNGEAWLAPEAPGIGIMRGFYTNLKLGGYDLGGADNGGIMSVIDRLLDIGVPLKTTEISTFKSIKQSPTSPLYFYKIITTTEITSVTLEPLDTSTTKLPGNDKEALPPLPNDDPEKCNCSCKKYAEYMALSKMSKKDKKNMDMSKFPQVDMKCIKECIPVWMKNCISIK